MRHTYLALGALLAAVATPAFAHGAAGGCTAPIPLDLSGPRPMVTLTNGAGVETKALFDTGAMGTVVASDQAERLGLTNEGPLGAPFAGHGTGYKSSVHGMRVGGLRLPDGPVAVLPAMIPGIGAVLSPQSFVGRLVRLDLAAGTLALCPASLAHSLGKATPYIPGPFALPGIPLSIGGQAVAALIDTGSPLDLAFPMRFAKTLPLDGPLVAAGKARSHDGEHPVFKARIKGALKVGPVTLSNPEVRFSDVVPEPNVGGALLRRMVITIDAAGKRSWVQAGR
ncbi:MAG: pepsin/retropepsin-like aspartic protease family protein [Sphingomicrobium sp.]